MAKDASIAVDKSNDINDIAQLAVFERYYDSSEHRFWDILFGMEAFLTRTATYDIKAALDKLLQFYNRPNANKDSAITDGAPTIKIIIAVFLAKSEKQAMHNT